jgi:hypothetical protein
MALIVPFCDLVTERMRSPISKLELNLPFVLQLKSYEFSSNIQSMKQVYFGNKEMMERGASDVTFLNN